MLRGCRQRAFSRITALVLNPLLWFETHSDFVNLFFPLTQLCRQLTYVSHMHHRCQCGSFNYSICALAEAENPAKAILVFSFGEHICLRSPCGSVMANAWRPCGQGLGHVRSSTPFPNDSLIVLTAVPDSCSSATPAETCLLLSETMTHHYRSSTAVISNNTIHWHWHRLQLLVPSTPKFCSHIDVPIKITVPVSSIH